MKRLKVMIWSVLLCFVFILCAVPHAAAESDFYDEAELLEIRTHIEKDAAMSKYATVQGACTDGKYAYFAVQEYSTVILKYDLKTWKLKKKAAVENLGHANDMTYNAREDMIVVANNEADDDVLTLLDPESLEITGTVQATRKKTTKEKEQDKDDKKDEKVLKVYSVAYQEAEDRYVVGLSGSYHFALLDHDFKMIKQFKGEDTGCTRQGCDCDGDYIYFAQSDNGNAVVIYDYSGKHIDTVSLNHSHELENLFHVGSDFYLTLHYYGNSVRRAGFSKETQIRFGVQFDAASGEGEMKPAAVHYGEATALPKCTFQKAGYFFGGWRAKRAFDGSVLGRRFGSDQVEWLKEKDVYDPVLLQDRAKVAQLTRIGDVTLSACWISNQYEVNFDPGSGEGEMDAQTVDYAAAYTVPESGFTKYGNLCVGYTARRSCDGRVYGIAAGYERPRWLDEQDAAELYLMTPGEEFSRLAYDGTVTLTAQFSSAFTYDAEQHTLISYCGIDEKVEIPNPSGELDTIAEGAFSDNTIMEELTVPSTVEVIGRGAVSRCDALRDILLREHLPADTDNEWIIGSGLQHIYIVSGGQPLFAGFYNSRYSADLIRRYATAIGLYGPKADQEPRTVMSLFQTR